MLGPALFAFQSLVAGETCPAPVDVDARVRVILHLGPEQELSEGFIVERHEAGLYVELRSADAALIGQRTLPAEGSCDELAQAAAVVLSSWLSDVHPDFAGVLPERPPHPEPEPEPEAEPKPESTPAPPPPQPVSRPKPLARATPLTISAPRRWDVALGLGTDVTSGQLALAGFLSVGYGAATRGFGLRALFIPTTPRTETLGPGSYTWRRWPIGLGPTFRLSTESVAWDFHAGPALGWLRFAGQLFDYVAQPAGVAWGGFVDVRGASRGRHWGVFGLADAQFYPAASRVYAAGVSTQASLARLSLAFCVGARFSP